MTAITLALLSQPAFATPSDGKKAELKEIQGRIEGLRQDLAKSEASKANLTDQLRDAESSISTANRKLRELTESRSAVQTEIGQLEQQSSTLGQQVDAQQKQLAGLLYRHFVHGDTDALQLLLSGEDPNRMAQDQYFLTQLSKAKAQLLGRLRDTLAEKQRLADARRDKATELAAIEKQAQESRAALVAKQKERQAVLARIADKIKDQRKEIATLKGNEQRLSKLIEGLARMARSHPKPAPTERIAKNPGKKEAATSGPVLRNDATPDASASGAFAALRGKLRLPVRGDVTARFGSPRADGGTTWKGLFIRATEGAEVKAVAAGQVVFSDWLRGFGNLLIVDHGDGYLSIYGNNQSLFRQAGQSVKAGEAVAAVGSSGGQGESGLYFELRHQGQPFDPLKWASLR
ncbi:MAG TPA: peptidoglycan DD-metalloendopeptidase family protein [Rhodocyclaceae bacterium]|nr:peptidoglycan DD-metalloendopeptidase family protein [Rhodocyclaceae bacterium]